MASIDSTQSTEPRIAYSLDIHDELNKKASQLHAMLVSIHGSGLESFNDLRDDIKDNFLWACSDLAEDIQNLARNIRSA